MKRAVRAFRFLLFLFILTICWSIEPSSICAQVRVTTIRPAQMVPAGAQQPGSVEVVAAGENSAGANAPGEQPEAAKETPAQKKLKLLLAAKFDRTAPAVLKAWSYQESADDEKKAAPQQRWSGKIVNAYESFVVFELDSDAKLKIGDVIEIRRDDKELGNAKVLSVDGKKVIANLVPLKEKEDASNPKTEPGDNASSAESKNESQPDAAGAAPAEKKGDSGKSESDAAAAEVQDDSDDLKNADASTG